MQNQMKSTKLRVKTYLANSEPSPQWSHAHSRPSTQDSQAHSEIQRVATGMRYERNGAFLALVCRDYQPYLHYKQPLSVPHDIKIPRLLMQLRWDGLIGFPGGKVDPGETLIDACVREAREEIGLRIARKRLRQLCTHARLDFASHLFAVEVTPRQLDQAAARSWRARDSKAEVCGVVTPNVYFNPDSGKPGIASFLQAPMAFSARQELLIVMEELSLLSRCSMDKLRELDRKAATQTAATKQQADQLKADNQSLRERVRALEQQLSGMIVGSNRLEGAGGDNRRRDFQDDNRAVEPYRAPESHCNLCGASREFDVLNEHDMHCPVNQGRR